MNSSLVHLALAAVIASASAVQAAPVTFSTALSGANEFPPAATPGSGFALVDFDLVAHTMRVRIDFENLLAGTTAAHIHCCTAVPGVGNVGVATPTPTFPGFPGGVTSGTYDHTFDTSSATSYSTGFLGGFGGNVFAAESALYAGLATGKAYLNIHSGLFPAGEIRGFLQVPEPATLALLGAGLAGLALTLRRRPVRPAV